MHGFFAWHCKNSSYQIQCIEVYQSYILVAHEDSSITNIAIAAMYGLTARILDVSNDYQNINVLINEIFFSVHHFIIWNGLKNNTLMLLSIGMTEHLSPVYEWY